jgi:hypothetical protein
VLAELLLLLLLAPAELLVALTAPPALLVDPTASPPEPPALAALAELVAPPAPSSGSSRSHEWLQPMATSPPRRNTELALATSRAIMEQR